ncbi:MAG: inverse autotransporter beta domain-containing protein [Halanaerobiales bacterium]|nr:inverse autotransporter beta domain-containing protein [Halanaerobiales bacterium]
MKKRLNLITILTISILLFFSANIFAEDLNRQTRLNFNGITGDDFIGQAGVLYPFRNTEDSLWFTDFRYRMSEDNVDEWNLGLGYRKKIDTAENTIAGIYTYKDRREEYDHYWDMWTVGGEILTDQWDFRLNGYITDDDQVLAPGSTAGGSSFKVRPEDQVLVYTSGNEVYYKSMNGLDIELGKRFTETETIFKNIGIYAKLFRFFESDTPTITGRQIRIDKQFGDRDKITWKIGAQWRDDNMRGSETEATFAVSIPFGEGETAESEAEAGPAEIIEARMTEQPERDLDVVVGESVNEESSSVEEVPVENPADGVENVQVWYVTQDGSENPDGSKENPFSIDEFMDYNYDEQAELPSNFTNEGDIIILSGKDDDIVLDNGGETGQEIIFLNPYQQLISSNKDGHALIENPINGETVKFTPEVDPAAVEYSAYSGFSPIPKTAVLLSDNNIVSGINFNIKSAEGIAVSDMNSFSPDAVDNGTEAVSDDYMIINNNRINFIAENPDNVTGIALSGHDEILIENNELKLEIAAIFSAVGIKINNSYSGLDNQIKIKGNTIAGFYLNEGGSPSSNSSIYIQDFSNDYTQRADFDNIVISGNTIKNTNFGISFRLNYDSYQELEEILEINQILYNFNLIFDNKYDDNDFDINDLIINEEEINKEDREVIIPSPAV